MSFINEWIYLEGFYSDFLEVNGHFIKPYREISLRIVVKENPSNGKNCREYLWLYTLEVKMVYGTDLTNLQGVKMIFLFV